MQPQTLIIRISYVLLNCEHKQAVNKNYRLFNNYYVNLCVVAVLVYIYLSTPTIKHKRIALLVKVELGKN